MPTAAAYASMITSSKVGEGLRDTFVGGGECRKRSMAAPRLRAVSSGAPTSTTSEGDSA